MELNAQNGAARGPLALAKPLGALSAAVALIAIVLLALGASPIGVFVALWEGAFGSWFALADTLVKSTPLVFTGLAIAVAFSGSLWNIGADGQLIIGALAAGAIGPMLAGWPRPLAIALVLAAGAAGGALWGGVCGWLRARRATSEVISTIMLNFVAMQLLSWAVHGPLIEPPGAYPKSVAIAPSARMYTFAPPSQLNPGMLLALGLALGCYFFLYRSTAGFELRALGKNRRAATFFGIPITAVTLWAMALSGALAGLGGAVQVSAITHRLYEKMSPGWGYEAIAVALVARLHPLWIVVAAIFFGALDSGAQAMQRTQGVSPVLVQVVQGLVILILLALDTPAFSRLRESFGQVAETAGSEETAPEGGDA